MAINRETFSDFKIVGECSIDRVKILKDFDWLSRVKKCPIWDDNQTYNYYLIQYNEKGNRLLRVEITEEDAMYIVKSLSLKSFANFFKEITYLFG